MAGGDIALIIIVLGLALIDYLPDIIKAWRRSP